MATELPPEIDPDVPPSGEGCKLCLEGDGPGWWVHLRRCAQCGQVGCCDSSPARHSTAHAHSSGHDVIASFEPGEDWFYSFSTGETFTGPPLAPPQSRPETQASPGPADKLPANWRDQIR